MGLREAVVGSVPVAVSDRHGDGLTEGHRIVPVKTGSGIGDGNVTLAEPVRIVRKGRGRILGKLGPPIPEVSLCMALVVGG